MGRKEDRVRVGKAITASAGTMGILRRKRVLGRIIAIIAFNGHGSTRANGSAFLGENTPYRSCCHLGVK